MRPAMDFARKVLFVACDQFYDEFVTEDPEFGGSSAQFSLCFLFRLLGFPFARKNSRQAVFYYFICVVWHGQACFASFHCTAVFFFS